MYSSITQRSVLGVILYLSFLLQVPEALISPSKSIEDSTISECPLLSAHRQDEHPLLDLPENPQEADHLKISQGTELLIPTENITVSFQNEVPDNYPRLSISDRHFVHSTKSNQVQPNQGNLQPETAVQAPYDFDITLLTRFPSMQDIGKDGSYHSENDEIQSGERRVAELQHQTSDTMETDNTESSLKELKESTQQCSLNELITDSASKSEGDFSHSTGHNILFEESHEPLLENPEMPMIKHDRVDGAETSGNAQACLMVGEVPDITVLCMLQPLGQTREDSVIQNPTSPARTSDPEVTKYQQQGQEPKPELEEVPEVLLVNVETPSGSENTAPKEECPSLTSLSCVAATSQSITTIVQVVAPEGGDVEPSITLKEPLSNEEFVLYNASFQKQEELKSQPALPCKTIKDSNADVILGKALIPSFAFLSATVCLIVGFHEPSIFLIMTLFLVSLCF